MERNVKDFMEKVKATASQAAEVAGKLADTAGKKASDLAMATKLNVKLFDLNTEIEMIYKEIGKSVYMTHIGTEVSPEEIEFKLVEIDERTVQVEEIKRILAERKAENKCPNCGNDCEKTNVFCSKCGFELR